MVEWIIPAISGIVVAIIGALGIRMGQRGASEHQLIDRLQIEIERLDMDNQRLRAENHRLYWTSYRVATLERHIRELGGEPEPHMSPSSAITPPTRREIE